MATKFIKCRCAKTGKHFAIEVKQTGSTYEAVNFVGLSDAEADMLFTEVKVDSIKTASSLLACKGCGNRKVGTCSCAKSKSACSAKYDFQCVYCNELRIDYSRSKLGPYSKWAGISNIPGATKDRFGNPQGSEYDLAQDGGFRGYTIVVLNLASRFCDFSQPEKALKKKGFEIVEFKSAPSLTELNGALSAQNSQLWVISDSPSFLSPDLVEAIYTYYQDKHGVYIWGDNDPFYADANVLLKRFFGLEMSGNSLGDKVLGVQNGKGQPGIIANHPITTGLVSFYEGMTIATVETKQTLTPLIYGSDGNVVTAYYDGGGRRALVDGGFTRLYFKWDSAGTDRYVVNAAAWLANVENLGCSFK